MKQFDSKKDYYSILGADESATVGEIERLYKRKAVLHHPDRGGSEEEMKAVNEAYGVLKDEVSRQAYDAQRINYISEEEWTPPVSSPSAQADAISGQGVGALLCLIVGLVLLMLVRFQWIWFLWPLAALGIFIMIAGVLMIRSTLLAVRGLLPEKHPARRLTFIQEALFWSIVCGGVYGLYLVLAAV